MDKNTPLHLQEIIFSSSNPEISRTISALVKEGKLKKIAPRIYTSNLDDDEPIIIKRNLLLREIVYSWRGCTYRNK